MKFTCFIKELALFRVYGLKNEMIAVRALTIITSFIGFWPSHVLLFL